MTEADRAGPPRAHPEPPVTRAMTDREKLSGLKTLVEQMVRHHETSAAAHETIALTANTGAVENRAGALKGYVVIRDLEQMMGEPLPEPGPEPQPEPEPTDPLIFSIDGPITASMHFPTGAWLGMRTLLLIARFDNDPTGHEKLAGAESSQDSRGGMGLGRQPDGDLEGWVGGPFPQPQTPAAARKASFVMWRLGEGALEIRFDDRAVLRPFSGPVAALDGSAVLGAGYWKQNVVDPLKGTILAAAGYREELSDTAIEAWISARAGLLDAVPVPPQEPPVTPPGDPSPDVPHPGGPTVTVEPGNAGSLLAAAPANADILMLRGDYSGLMLQPKSGQRWRFENGVRLLGNGRKHFLHGAAKDVALLGEAVITGYQPSPAGKNASGRANDETSIIEPTYDVATGWTIRGLIFRDCGKGCLTVTSHYDVRDIVCDLVEGAAISGRGNNMHLEGIRGVSINTRLRVAAMHHCGLIKLLGGERSVRGAPPRADIYIGDVWAENIASCYGAVWIDWALARVTIRDLHVNGSDYGAWVIEASALCEVIGGSARDCNRVNHHNSPVEWGGIAFLQNSHDCLVEGFDFYAANHARCAVAVMHHDRRSASGDALHGDTQPDSLVGRFTGTDNLISNCGFGGKSIPQIYVGCVPGWAGTCASVRASNRVGRSRSL